MVFFEPRVPEENIHCTAPMAPIALKLSLTPPQGMPLHDQITSEHHKRTACAVPFSMCARARPETENVVF